MNSSYICASCRRALGRTRIQATLQWPNRRTFISLSETTQQTTTNESRPVDSNDSSIRKEGKEGVSHNGQSSTHKTRNKVHSPDSLESLFQNSLQPPTPAPRNLSSTSPPPPSTVLDLYKNVDTLRKMLLEGGNEADAWLFFVEHFGPNSQKHAFDKSIVSRALLKDVTLAKRKHPLSTHLPSVTEVSTISYQLGLLNSTDWSNMMLNLIENIIILESSSARFPNEIERLLHDLLGAWNVVCRPVGNMKDLPTYESTSLNWSHIPRVSLHSCVKAFRREGAQKCFSLLTPSFHHRQAMHIPIIAVATFGLLSQYSTSNTGLSEAEGLSANIANIIRTPGLNVEHCTIGSAHASSRVVYDYAVQQWKGLQEIAHRIVDPSMRDIENRADRFPPTTGVASPDFKSDVNLLLGSDAVGLTSQKSAFLEANSSKEHISLSNRSRISKVQPPNETHVHAGDIGEHHIIASIDFRVPVERKTRVSIQNMRSKLDRAVRERDVDQADRLWAAACQWRFQPKSSEEKSKKHGGGVLTIFLLNKFIYSFMALRQPNRAIDVWNTMMKNGVRPDTDAWNAMLSGGRISRDAAAFDKIWQQMCSRNVSLTKESWNIRIAGLIDMWRIQDGLRTLDEMGRLWLSTAQAQYPKIDHNELFRIEEIMVKGVVKPSIETVNMTVAALLKKKKSEVVRPVFTWAARFGIAPSAFTYNVLLRPLVRAGDTTGAKALISEMKAAGVSPDAGTFVTIIDETLRVEDDYTAEEQAAVVNQIFEEMETVGLEPTQGLYGHIIHGLIDNLKKHGSSNLSVVNTVMARMASQGWQPGSVEYTELAKFLFDQHPPDIKAVDQLIARSRLNAKSLNHIFWDSVLEGYARTGQTVKALQVYKESKEKGGWQADHSKIAWRALRELVMALTRDGDWETAKAVVAHKVVENGGIVLPPDHDTRTDGHVSQFAFWELARSLDLLEKKM